MSDPGNNRKESYSQIEETLDAILHRQAHGPLYDGPKGEKTPVEFFQVVAATRFLLTRVKEQEKHLSLLLLTVHMLLGVAIEDLPPPEEDTEQERRGGEEEEEIGGRRPWQEI